MSVNLPFIENRIARLREQSLVGRVNLPAGHQLIRYADAADDMAAMVAEIRTLREAAPPAPAVVVIGRLVP